MGADQSGLNGSPNAVISPKIRRQRSRQRNWDPNLDRPSEILSEDAIRAVHGCLGKQLNRTNWHRIYSLEHDGASLHTLLDLSGKHSNCVLVMQDSEGCVFGGITAHPWGHNAHYFGTVQSMVFKLTQDPPSGITSASSAPAVAEANAPALPGAPQDDSLARSQSQARRRTTTSRHGAYTCTAYRWAGGNRYFQTVSAKDATSSIAMGGGGAFAWSLDEELLHGSSGACDTFASPQLSGSAQFSCTKLELWSLQPAQAADALDAAANTGLGGASASLQAGS